MTKARHIVLAGDSIFDNDGYVLGEPGVIEQMRRALPKGWSAFKIAVDGDVIADVERQVESLPTHATDLVVSVGGNDALGYSELLNQVRSPADIARVIRPAVAEFSEEYGAMLELLKALPVRLYVCTIYTAIPFTEPLFRAYAPLGIAAFNDAIIAEASKRGVPVLRLDQVCTEADDFAAVSPIEPSAKGGQKIVNHILATLAAAGC
jgi:lysophospholipase L1-like esterase